MLISRCSFAARSPSLDFPDTSGNDAEYGTMREIRIVHTLPDGRLVVATCGAYRLGIAERAMRDGYTVARTERTDDYMEELLLNAS